MSLTFPDPESVVDHGTLLWVGDRDAEAFCDAYDFCESHVAQLAYRCDLRSALLRPATSVRTILCCRDNDATDSLQWFGELRKQHRDARTLLLLGPLCSGARPSPGSLFDVPTVRWHDWQSQLPAYLRRCGWANESQATTESVAVVAASYANASSLLTIATAGGRPAVWCRPEQRSSLRNFDEIWWDDSATIGRSWSELLGKLEHSPREQVWVSSDVHPRSRREALQAGINLVIAKPGDFSLLIERVCGSVGVTRRHAA